MENKPRMEFTPKEEYLQKRWAGKAGHMPVNEIQYRFDSPESEEDFIRTIFDTPEELTRYRSYRAEWFRRSKEFDPGDAPLAVCCELVSFCNLSCPMCYSITEEFQASVVGAQRMMPWRIVKDIIDECARLDVPSMLFSWRGESTLYRTTDEEGRNVAFPDVLEYARKRGILEITSLTNGQHIDESLAKAIVDAEPSWISISIDGLEKNYNKIRTPAHKKDTDYNAFKEVTRNIKRMVTYRDRTGRHRPQFRSNTIYPPIAEDPMAYYEAMKDLRIGLVTVNEILDFRGSAIGTEEIVKDWACQYPFQRLTVSANGSVIPCTGAHNEERDLILGRYRGSRPKEVYLNGKNEVIEFQEMTLKEAWHSIKLENIRKIHKANRRCEISACRYCRHGMLKHGADWIPEDWDMETMKWRGHEWRE